MKKLIITFLLPFTLLTFFTAQAGVASKDKADFVLSLIDKVEWPNGTDANTGGEFVITVIGNCDYMDALTSGAAAIAGKKIVVKTAGIDEDFSQTQMLLIATTELSDLAKILKKVKAKPVLTVTESKGFARYGVMVELITDGTKIEYVINKMSAKEVSLTINSKLVDKAKTTYG